MPQPASSALRQAIALVELRRFDDAAGLLAQVIASEPGSAQPRCLLAQCHLGRHDAAGALDAANGAASVEPGSEWAHRLRAIALLQLKRQREALAAAQEAVRLSAQQASGYIVLSEAELANRHTTAAATAAERARQLAPESASGHAAMGLVALRVRRYARAEEHFRAALAKDPQNAQAMNNLGVALLRQGRKPQAIHYFAAASRLDPRLPMPRRNAVSAAKGGTAALAAVIVALQVLRLTRADIEAPLLVAAPLIVVLVLAAAAVVTRRRRAIRGTHDDPSASRQLIRELRREPGGRGIRIGWLARSVGTSVLGLVGMTLLLTGGSAFLGGNLVGGGAGIVVGVGCLAACAALVHRATGRGRRLSGRQ